VPDVVAAPPCPDEEADPLAIVVAPFALAELVEWVVSDPPPPHAAGTIAEPTPTAARMRAVRWAEKGLDRRNVERLMRRSRASRSEEVSSQRNLRPVITHPRR
jgi:hypothetical protein